MPQNKIKEILDMLNTLNEYFLSLPDDMLLNIDPRDNKSLEDGLNFIRNFNDELSQFSTSSSRIESQIKEYFSINPEEDDLENENAKDKSNARIIKELDSSVTHKIDENFTYKRPYGFVLKGSAYKGLKTWKSLYINVLRELKELNPDLFKNLPGESKFISKRGNPIFSKNESSLRVGERIEKDFYIEVNLSANHIRNVIIELLDYFGINANEIKIYLREDRGA